MYRLTDKENPILLFVSMMERRRENLPMIAMISSLAHRLNMEHGFVVCKIDADKIILSVAFPMYN